jgi:hypothetical protein
LIIFEIVSIFKVNNHSSSNYARHSIYKIRVAFYTVSLKNGGVERVVSLLIKYLSKEKNFIIYLITNKRISDGEYLIPNQIKRISLFENSFSLIKNNLL